MKKSTNAVRPLLSPALHDRLTGVDRTILAATQGDARALLAVHLAFGPELLREARVVLGPLFHQDAGDVVQDLMIAMLEGTRLRCPPIAEGALPWLRRTVRELAKEHLRRRGPELGEAG